MLEVDHQLPRLPHEWQLQVELRCASICGCPLPARITNRLLRLRDVSLMELYICLAAGRLPELRHVVATSYERARVIDAYKRFHAALLASRRRGRARSDTLAWIIPDGYLNSASRVSRDRRAFLMGDIQRELGFRHTSENILEWLPWMSLGMVASLRRWRTPRIRAVRRALFKLGKDLDSSATAFGPWEPTFAAGVRPIPFLALYQYESTRLLEDSLRRFEELGLTCVNDLRFLHPDAVAAAKEPCQPLLKLYRALRRDG